MSALAPKADMCSARSDVPFTAESRHGQGCQPVASASAWTHRRDGCPSYKVRARRDLSLGHEAARVHCLLWANSGHQRYSITSSARANTADGIVKPISFAALRLTTRSILFGNITGRSVGLSPFKIRPQ